jgi:glycosyltransferase involved in cell wall biosynthesis
MHISSTESQGPVVSVVLPTYNRAGFIGRSIRSVLAQTYTDFELIVVDDGSRDETTRVVAGLATDRRLRYLPLDENRGAAVARNAGVRAAHGPFLAFQDSDDEWVADKLARHMQAFAAAPDAGVVYSDMRRILADGSSRDHRSPTVGPGGLIDPATRFYRVCGLGIQSVVIRRECFEAVGGFNESFPALEDLELFIRLSQRVRFLHLPLQLVKYHETDGLSKNTAAKLVARQLLLELYGRDLERTDAGFLHVERLALASSGQAPMGA